MTVWQVEWKDTKGWHNISYSGVSAVTNHVEYCLKHGWAVRNIHVITLEIPNNAKSRCIFSTVTKQKSVHAEDILNVLRNHGEMTPLEIANRLGSKYDSERVKKEPIRHRLYALRVKGLVEQVPDTNPIKWRAIE